MWTRLERKRNKPSNIAYARGHRLVQIPLSGHRLVQHRQKNAEFVYYTNPAFIIFPGEKPYFFCNFNEKLLPHDQKDRAGALFMVK